MGFEPSNVWLKSCVNKHWTQSFYQLQPQEDVANYEKKKVGILFTMIKKSFLQGTGPALNQYLPHAIKLIFTVVISI